MHWSGETRWHIQHFLLLPNSSKQETKPLIKANADSSENDVFCGWSSKHSSFDCPFGLHVAKQNAHKESNSEAPNWLRLGLKLCSRRFETMWWGGSNHFGPTISGFKGISVRFCLQLQLLFSHTEPNGVCQSESVMWELWDLHRKRRQHHMRWKHADTPCWPSTRTCSKSRRHWICPWQTNVIRSYSRPDKRRRHSLCNMQLSSSSLSWKKENKRN